MKKSFIFVFIVLLFIAGSFVLANEDNEEYIPITVTIEGKEHQLYCLIVASNSMEESSEYRIKDDETREIDFYVSGCRKHYGSGSTRWSVTIHNIPNFPINNSILLNIYLKKTKHEARALYKEIMWQIYEKIGFPEDK